MQVDSAIELGCDDPALEFPWTADGGKVRYYDLKNDPALIDEIPEVANNPELRAFLLRVNAADFALQTAKSDVWGTDEILPEEEIYGAAQKFVCYVDLIFADDALRFSLAAHTHLTTRLCKLLQSAPEMASTVEFVLRHCHYHRVERDSKSRLDASLEPTDDSTAAPNFDDSGSGETKRSSSCRMSDSHSHGVTDSSPSRSSGSSSASTKDSGCGKMTNSVLKNMTDSVLNNMSDSQIGFCLTAYVSGFGESDQEARLRWSIALTLLQHALVQAMRA